MTVYCKLISMDVLEEKEKQQYGNKIAIGINLPFHLLREKTRIMIWFG